MMPMCNRLVMQWHIISIVYMRVMLRHVYRGGALIETTPQNHVTIMGLSQFRGQLAGGRGSACTGGSRIRSMCPLRKPIRAIHFLVTRGQGSVTRGQGSPLTRK